MSKRHGKGAGGDPSSAGNAGREMAGDGMREWVTWSVTAAFLLLLVVYLILFYRVEYAAGVPRYAPLGYLLVPEVLFSQWCGTSVGEVSLTDRIAPFAVAASIGGVALLLGRWVLRVLRVLDRVDPMERFVFATGLGLSGCSLATLAVGLAGGLRQPLIFVMLAAVICGESAWHAGRRRALREKSRAPRETKPGETKPGDATRLPALSAGQRGWWVPRWWWLALPFVAIIFLGAALPPIHFDVLEYHLQVPKEWAAQGRVGFLPHNVYGNMPLGAEMLATLSMALTPDQWGWWWGALSGKILMAGFSPLAALLLFAAGRRLVSVEAGVVACLVYVSTGWIAHVSVNGLNEGVFAFYLLAAFYATKLWLDVRRDDRSGRWGLLVLAGLMAGSAAACKYTAIVFVVVPLTAVVMYGSRRQRWLAPLVFAVAVTVACGLWLGKNWILTGNPTYPLMVRVFDGETRTPEKDAQWSRAHRVPLDAAGRRYSVGQAWQSLLHVLGASPWHNPILVPLAALAFVGVGRLRHVAFWLMSFLVVTAMWWLFTHRIDRFWVPALPLLALVAGIGATWSSAALWRRVLWSVLILGSLANLALIASPLPGDNRYFVRLEQLRDDPRLATVPVAHRYLNANLPAGRRALLVGDAAVFDLRVSVLYNTCFDTCIFEELLRGYDPADRAARLAERRVSHIYVNWAEIRRYRQPGNYGFTDYVTPEFVHDELEIRQKLLRRIQVPDLDPEEGELFEVLIGAD